METHFKSLFKLYLFNAFLAFAFGLLLFFIPKTSVYIFIIVLASYLLIEGIIQIINVIRMPKITEKKWLRVMKSIIGIILGIIILFIPKITAAVLLYIFAFWYIAIGINEIIFTVNFKNTFQYPWYSILIGILSAVFGTFLAAWLTFMPESGVIAVIWLIGLAAMCWAGAYFVQARHWYLLSKQERG